MWRAWRSLILSEWREVGSRPRALWIYDLGLKRAPWPREWAWPSHAVSEADAVHKLIVAGELQPIVPDELAQIEAGWLELIERAPAVYQRDHGECLATWHGVPRAFSRKHLPRVLREPQQLTATVH